VRRLMTLTAVMLATTLLLAPSAPATAYPDTIPVPSGSYPEGVTIGLGHQLYVSSLLDGSIYRADLRTGEGEVFAPGAEGRITAGLYHDARSGLVWAAGLDGGASAVIAFDGTTGDVAVVVPVPQGAFLNDLVVTRDAVYVTDSLADVFWTIPLGPRGLPAGPATATTLSGDFTFVTTGDLPVNLNGIRATADGRTLIAINSTAEELYTIDPATGEATIIDLGGPIPFGDGIVLRGRTLYVIQNFVSQVAVVELAPDLGSGTVVATIADPALDVPTTGVFHGDRLYAVNARFNDGFPPFLGGPTLDLDYDVVRVPIP
jgi:sugar lactone lactonase YvrE